MRVHRTSSDAAAIDRDRDRDRSGERDADLALAFAGAAHDDGRSDLRWLRDRYRGNPTIGAFAYALRKAFRRCATRITLDWPSFTRALASVPPGALLVLAPSHRSYFDFLLTCYLCFEHPELAIPMPAIAAAEEFGKIPVVGAILRSAGAFYLRRGVGREAPELTWDLRQLADRGASLMVFVEGQRSRARRFLPAKRGILRGLATTGKTFAVLPIAIAYDRLPEERALAHELTGGARPRMSLRALAGWLAELGQGRVQLGNVHVACGAALALGPDTDVPALARAIVAEHQRHMAVTSFHLRAFLAESGLGAAGVTEAWLARAITRRGGRVLASDLPVPSPLPAAVAHSLRNQWLHWFYGDALARYPASIAVRDHIARNAWSELAPAEPGGHEPALAAVVDALFAPIARDFAVVADRLARLRGAPLCLVPAELVRAEPGLQLPAVEDACRALADRGVLHPAPRGAGYTWGPRPDALDALIDPLMPADLAPAGLRRLA